MDRFALRSHQRAAEATAIGRFQDEIVPIEIHSRKGTTFVTRDEPIRASFTNGSYELGTSLEQLAGLRPAFEKDGLVTLINALHQRGLRRGIAALCLGGGEAVAMAIET